MDKERVKNILTEINKMTSLCKGYAQEFYDNWVTDCCDTSVDIIDELETLTYRLEKYLEKK